jgi:hypothetical protein
MNPIYSLLYVITVLSSKHAKNNEDINEDFLDDLAEEENVNNIEEDIEELLNNNSKKKSNTTCIIIKLLILFKIDIIVNG